MTSSHRPFWRTPRRALLTALALSTLASCGAPEPSAGQLQQVIDEAFRTQGVRPGSVVQHEVDGDWAYVRATNGDGELVRISANGRPTWTVMSFGVSTDEGVAVVTGGNLARQKYDSLDAGLRGRADVLRAANRATTPAAP